MLVPGPQHIAIEWVEECRFCLLEELPMHNKPFILVSGFIKFDHTLLTSAIDSKVR